ncbi:patellin-6-like [Wolffia australiana]
MGEELRPTEKKALAELKALIAAAPPAAAAIWGVPLAGGDERTDVVLLKFLRARDLDPAQAHAMLSRCVAWRRDFGADGVPEEDLGLGELDGVVAYMHGRDRQGRPVCYNAYGAFKDADLFDRAFGDEPRLERFLRWRVQLMERGLRLLHFKPGGVHSIVQVTDLRDMPNRELRAVSARVLSLFQDNYPELVARKVFINVPWYFSLIYAVFSPFLTERTKSKFVLAREGAVEETLYRFISPEFVPAQYGGLSRPGESLDPPPKPASEFSVRGGEKVNLEIDGIEAGTTMTWELVVAGWDVEYAAEYVPAAAAGYSLAIAKPRRIAAGAPPLRHTFAASEPGRMVLSIDNSSRRRKVAAYRYSVRKPPLNL